MPYFVYQKSQEGELSFLNTHDKFRDAKQEVTNLRVNRAEGDTNDYRMVFAKDRQEARRLVTVKRDMSSPLQEWEEKL